MIWARSLLESIRASKRLLSFSGVLVLGEGFSALFTMASLALLARTLGPDGFGSAAVIVAYVLAFDVLFNFQSSRALVRYGAKSVSANMRSELAGTILFCFVLDVASAAVAFFVAVSVSAIVDSILPSVSRTLIVVYSVTIIFNLVGHSTGVLQIFEQFNFLAFHKAASSLIRLIAVSLVYLTDEPTLARAIIALALAEIIGKCILLWRGWLEVRRRGLPWVGWHAIKAFHRRNPSALNFSIYSNLNDAVLKVVQQIDVFLVGLWLTPTDAGSLKIMKSLASIFAMINQSISQVIYPEMARLLSGARSSLRPFIRHLMPILILFSAIGYGTFLLFGEPLITGIFGEEYRSLFVPSAVFLSGSLIGMIALPLTPLLLAAGRQRQLFIAYTAGSAAYIATLGLGSQLYGLLGAAFALPLLYAAYTATIFSTRSLKGI